MYSDPCARASQTNSAKSVCAAPLQFHLKTNHTPAKVLKTGLTPSASGSAYLELEPTLPDPSNTPSAIPQRSSLKLTCTVHGPRPLPRSAPFSPQLLLSTHVKFAPFASRQRRGYIQDAGERDLGVHLEAALRGVIIGDRWPKSGAEVIVTVLEGEEHAWWGDEAGLGGERHIGLGGCGLMTVLAGCITVASAALVDAGIDCVDLVSGGVAAIVRTPCGASSYRGAEEETQLVLDPCPSDHGGIIAAAVVAYLASRDELTEIWMKGDVGAAQEDIIERAVDAAKASRLVLADAVKEGIEAQLFMGTINGIAEGGGVSLKTPGMVTQEVQMTG